MKKLIICLTILILTGVAGSGIAQDQIPWETSQIRTSQKVLLRFGANNYLSPDLRKLPSHSQPVDLQQDRAASLNAVPLGRGQEFPVDPRTCLNPLISSNLLNAVAFVHPQDPSLYGGGSNNLRLRYDLSLDGGLTFTTDIGPAQDSFPKISNYASIQFLIRDSSQTNPFSHEIVWSGINQVSNAGEFAGFGSGSFEINNVAPLGSKETYNFQQDSIGMLGGLCSSGDGVFWQAAFHRTGDSLFVYRGKYNSAQQEVIWSKYLSVVPNHNLAVNQGEPVFTPPNMGASPNGKHIWLAWLGDLVGGSDSVLNPIFLHSSDGGSTWDSVPQEVDIRNTPWISDTLTSFWTTFDTVSGMNVPAGTGRPTLTEDFDLIVDLNGNPHLGVVVANAGLFGGAPPNYTLAPSLGKFVADISSIDQGSNWDTRYLAPALTYQGDFGTSNNNSGFLRLRNFVQVSRDNKGERIFFSWVDSDTCQIGLANYHNIAPNILQTSVRVTDGTQTPFYSVTAGDILWEGRILFPYAAQEVLTSASQSRFYVPIAFLELITNDQSGPYQWHYFGNDAQVLESDYVPPQQLNLYWNNCPPVSIDPEILSQNIRVFPNPSSGSFRIQATDAGIRIQKAMLFSPTGKLIQEVRTDDSENLNLDAGELPEGLYLCRIQSSRGTILRKVLIH